MNTYLNLQGSPRTRFWVSEDGFLVVEQEAIEFGKEITFLLTPDQVEILYEKLPAFMQQQQESWTGYDQV